MAEFRELNRIDPDSFEWGDLIDSRQVDNFVYGILRASDGVEQAITEMAEFVGAAPKGSSKYKTQQLKAGQEEYLDRNFGASQLDGAIGFQLAGELAPSLLVPVGGSVKSAATLGGLVGGSMFQDNPEEQNRLAQAGVGAALGGAVRLGMDRLRPRNMAQETLVNNPAIQGQRALPQQAPIGLPAPQRQGTFPPQGRATIVPDAPSPVNAGQARLVDDTQLTLPRPAPKASGPADVSTAQRLGNQGIGADDFQRAGMNPIPGMRGVPQKVSKLKEHLTRSKESFKSLANLTPAEKSIRKLGYGSFAKASAAAERKITRAAEKLTRQAAAMERSIAGLSPAKAAKLKERLDKVTNRKVAADATKQFLKGRNKLTRMVDKPLSRKQAYDALKKNDPSITNKDLGPKKIKELREMVEQQRPANGADWGNQRGSSDVTGLTSVAGAGVGALVGAAASDEDPLMGAVLGAAGGGIAGAKLPGFLKGQKGKQVNNTRRIEREATEEVFESYKAKEPLRKVSSDSAEFKSKVDAIVKTNDLDGNKISRLWSEGVDVMDSFLGGVMTRLEKLSPTVATALSRAEWLQSTRSGKMLNDGEVLFGRLKAAKLNDADQKLLKIYMLNNTKKAEAFLRSKQKTDAANAIGEFRTMMGDAADYLHEVNLAGFNRMTQKELANALRQASPKTKGVKNMDKETLLARLKAIGESTVRESRNGGYFPRKFNSLKDLSRNKDADAFFKELQKQKGQPLSDLDKDNALEALIKGELLNRHNDPVFARVSSNLKRRINKVDQNNVDDYMDLQASFNGYAESITTMVERRRFLQGQGVNIDDLGIAGESVETIARRLTSALTSNGADRMTVDQVAEVAKLISLRFGPGEQASHRAIQNFKNLTYTGLLGNPMSALTQIGDLAISAHRNGIRNTVSSVLSSLGGGNKLSGLDVKDILGINNVAADFASNTSTRDVLNWSLKWSGFRSADRFGKNTFIRSALKNNQQLDQAAFKTRWGKTFDPDSANGATPRTDALFNKVRNFEKITPENREDISFMLWNELAGAQPISLSQFPEQYLANPNGRMMYMLQSFTLKTFDIIRKDIVDQARAGNFVEAGKNLTKFTSLYVVANGSVDSAKNFILGKEASVDEVVLNNVLKMWGLNKYMIDSVGRDGLGGALLKTVAPPVALFDAATDAKKATSMIPIVGRNLAAFQ